MPRKETTPQQRGGGVSGQGYTPWRGIANVYPSQRRLKWRVPLLRVGVFIDGFNLYFGVREMSGHKHLWLDLEKLSNRILRKGQTLEEVKYITAMVRNQPDSMDRQERYLQALAAFCPRVSIHKGRFQETTVRCRSCNGQYVKYEEKESDVLLASRLVERAAQRAFEMALLITADSDMIPAIQAAKRINPDLRIVVAMPPRRNSDELKQCPEVDAWTKISHQHIRRAQLPDSVEISPGVLIARPDYWR